jgi:hypothetical protein
VGSTARPAINLSCCWDPWGVRAVSPTPTPRGLWVFFCAREVKFARVGRETTSERGTCFRLSCPMAWPVGGGWGQCGSIVCRESCQKALRVSRC